MKLVLSVSLVLLIALLTLGCDRAPFSSESKTIIGSWYGTAIAGYPGPADEPLADTADLFIIIKDSGFTIFAAGSSDPDSVVPPLGLEGEYTIVGDSIFLAMYTQPIARHPLFLYGGFSLELTDSTLRMYQVFHPEIWPEYHEVTLERTPVK